MEGRHDVTGSLGLCILLIAIALPCGAAFPAAAVPATIENDPRLQAPVDAGDATGPAGEIIGRMSRGRGIVLSLEPNLARIPLLVRPLNAPLHRLLASIASRVDARWTLRPDGFHLESVPAGRDPAEQQRKLEAAAAVTQLRKEVELLAVDGRLNAAALRRKVAGWEARMAEIEAAPPGRRAELRAGAAYLALLRRQGEIERARILLRPGALQMVQFLQALDNSAWKDLPAEGQLIWASGGVPGARGLTRSQAAGFREVVRHRMTPGENARDPANQASEARLAAWNGPIALLAWLDLDGASGTPKARLEVQLRPLAAGGVAPPPPEKLVLTGQLPYVRGFGKGHSLLPRSAHPLRLAELPDDDWLTPLLHMMGQAYGAPVVADGYREQRLRRPPIDGVQDLTLEDALRKLVEPVADWEWQDGVLVVRRKGWAWYQQRSPNQAAVRDWAGRLRGVDGELGLADLAKLLGEVTFEQLPQWEKLLLAQGVRVTGLPLSAVDIDILRAWRALTPAQQAAAQAGGLPSAFLPAPAGQALRTALLRRARATQGEVHLPEAPARLRVEPADARGAATASKPLRRVRLVLEWESGLRYEFPLMLPRVSPVPPSRAAPREQGGRAEDGVR